MFEFGANTNQSAEYTGGNEEQCKAREETPGCQQNRFTIFVEIGEKSHGFSQARELNLIEVLLLRATSLMASRVASSVGRATDF